MSAATPRKVVDVPCTACSCLCDDIELTVDGQAIVAASTHGCQLGQDWFLRPKEAAATGAMIGGRPVPFAAAVEEAAVLLAQAKYPLVCGLSTATCEAQRLAVAIADWTGGLVDTATSEASGLSGSTFSGVGEVTCSLGEIRHRGDLLIFWGADPQTTHPRHLERYSLDPPGMFVPGGRADRTCVVVDVRRTATVDRADLFLQIKPGCDFEALWVLRALLKDIVLDAAAVKDQTGVALEDWQTLCQRMKQARFGVVMFGTGLSLTSGGYLNAEAVWALTRDLNAHTRFVCLPLRGGPNVAGADSVMLWTTGYLFGVNFARGYPRFGPGEFTAPQTLARGEPDVALVLGDPAKTLDAAALEQLRRIPCILVDSGNVSLAADAQVVFHTATPGVETTGTMYRLDDVPLSLRPVLTTKRATDVEVLSRIEDRVKALRGYGAAPVRRDRPRLV